MTLNRRSFLAVAAAAASPKQSQIESFRQEFPRAVEQVYLDAAAHMPLPRYTADGMRKYLDFHMYGPGQGRGEYASQVLRQVKPLFAKLINAKPSEIGFVICTKAGEAAVVNGLDIQASGGNVVTNDLHYAGALHDYLGRRKAGLDVRIVRRRDWRIDLRDMEKVIDKKTKLVSITLVSNVNGHVEDAKALSDLAHANGAYLYADIIQAAGSVPVDVRALGIDFAACSCYKWLQGARGSGFLYVREDLQGRVVRDLVFPGYTDISQTDLPYRPPQGGGRYEAGNVSYVAYAGQTEALQRMLAIGVDNIWAHTKPMCDRLKKELPGLGYKLITPPEAVASLVVVEARDLRAVEAKLKRANIQVTTTGGNRVRISPAIYNNMQDIEKLLAALA
jgi:selenocysteine lyase/cysteine desulfurase